MFAVEENIKSKPLRAAPNAQNGSFRVDGRTVFEFGGDFNHSLVNHDGDGVKVSGKSFETEPLSFKGNGAAAGEGVEDSGQIVADRFFNFGERVREKFFVAGVFPRDDFANEFKKPFAFFVLKFYCREFFWVFGGVVNKRREQNSAGGS